MPLTVIDLVPLVRPAFFPHPEEPPGADVGVEFPPCDVVMVVLCVVDTPCWVVVGTTTAEVVVLLPPLQLPGIHWELCGVSQVSKTDEINVATYYQSFE